MRAAPWLGLVVGAGVVAGLAALLNRVLRPAREARLYTEDARAATETIEERLRSLAGLEDAARRAARLREAL